MDKLWFLRNLKMRQKIFLICLIFTAPIGTLLYFFIQETNRSIDLALRELDGVAYMKPLYRALEDLQEYKGLSHRYRKGNTSLKDRTLEMKAKITEDFAQALEADRKWGPELGGSAQMILLQTRWSEIQKVPENPGASSLDQAMDDLSGATHQLFLRVGDTSNLILDPDLDSYYTIDNITNKIPDNALFIGRLMNFHSLFKNPKDGSLSAGDKEHLTALSGLAASNLEDMRRNTGESFEKNPAQNLKSEVSGPLEQTQAASQELLEAINGFLLGPHAKAAPPGTFLGLGTGALEANSSFWDSSVKGLEEVLDYRIRLFQVKRNLTLLGVTGVTLLSYLLALFLLRSIQNPLRQVADRMKGFNGGEPDFGEKLVFPNRDEIGELAEAFNAFMGKLRIASQTGGKVPESQGLLGSILEQTSDGLVVADRNGKMVYMNPMADKILGKGLSAGGPEIWAKEYGFFIQDAGNPCKPEDIPLSQALNGTETRDTVLFLQNPKRPDGAFLRVDGTPLRSPAGETVGALMVLRDITEREKSRERQRLLASILEQTPDAVLVTDLAGVVIQWNKGAEKTFGYSAAEAIGKFGFLVEPGDRPGETKERRKALREGKDLGQYETTRKRKDGQLIHLSVSASVLKDHADRPMGYAAIYRDITEQLKAQERQRILSYILEQTTDAVLVADMDEKVIEWNRGAEKMFGYTRDEVLGKKLGFYVPPSLAQESAQMRQANKMGFETRLIETVRLRKDRTPVQVSIAAGPLVDSNGEIIAISAIFRDIGEQLKSQENQRLLASILEQTPDAVVAADLDEKIIQWNQGAERMFGYSPEEALGKPFGFLVPDHLVEEGARGRKALFAGGKTTAYETTRKRKDGTLIQVEVSAAPLLDSGAKIMGISAIYRDITQQKKAQENQRFLAYLLEQTPDAVVVADLDEKVLQWNEGAEKVFGWKREEAIGRVLGFFVPPHLAEEGGKAREALKKGHQFIAVRTTRMRKDGRLIEVEGTAGPIKDPLGKVVAIAAIFRDITEKLKAQESQRLLAYVMEESTEAILVADLDGNIIQWNKGAEQIFGYTAEEALGKPGSLLDPEDKPEAVAENRKALRESGEVMAYETTRKRKDGQSIQVAITAASLKDPTGQLVGYSAIYRDISEKKRAEESLRRHEEQMRQLDKMNAIGRLAGGVAHDFNNLLSVIGGNAEFLLSSTEKEKTPLEELKEIQNAVRRGAGLTKQLLVFSRKQVVQPQAMNLNDTTTELHKMLKRVLDPKINLSVTQDKDLRLVQADPGQIQQAVMNLALNARDAMPEGGILAIGTKNIPTEELNQENRSGLMPGDYVRLTVADTGSGMSPEIQKHIFEPFFTTKAEKGTGLGLANVYGIVTQWNGHIFLQSAPGKGTTFTLYFPALPKAGEAAVQEKAPSEIPKGTETILVVEDEDGLRKLIVRSLKGWGYEVLEAGDVLEALKKSRDRSGKIHLLLTDTIMPKMNGRELAEEIRKHHPDTQVLFMSGYPQEVLSQQGILDSGIQLVQKPFELDELARWIRKVLDKS